MTTNTKILAVTDDLRRRLAAREWEVGGKLPSFYDLSEQYDALSSVYRCRAALAPLINEGWIVSQQGAGTFVRAIPSAATPDANAVTDESVFVQQILDQLDALRATVVAYRDRHVTAQAPATTGPAA